MNVKQTAKIKRRQWNIRIRPEYVDAVQGLAWKTKFSQYELAELGIAILLGLDKKDGAVNRCRVKALAAAEEIGVMKGLPTDHFTTLAQS